MWDTYDADNSGSLDKEETKKFIKDTLVKIKPGHDFSDEIFDKMFKSFDTDGSGTVEKSEMAQFVKKIIGSGNKK